MRRTVLLSAEDHVPVAVVVDSLTVSHKGVRLGQTVPVVRETVREGGPKWNRMVAWWSSGGSCFAAAGDWSA